MSIFVPVTVPCPACQQSVEFRVVHSVNADRRPDLRVAILDRSFQRESCEKCGETFRMEPELTFFDCGRKQWILVQPSDRIVHWPELEQQARDTYERTYGANASLAAQALGRELSVRIAFGWAALREKLLCADHQLDDATLECLKTMLVRGLDDPPLADTIELRLMDVEESDLVMSWIDSTSEGAYQTFQVPRSLFDDITADDEAWSELQRQLTAGPFVDMHRLLIPVESE